MGDILAVIGAQYGSEGKGVIVNSIADRYQIHVRVGGPNAGHSFYHNHKRYAMQSIPCGWTNPDADLIIGAGAVLSIDTLKRELSELKADGIDLRGRLHIDVRAIVITESQHAAEGGVTGELHQRIGSTGEGVGAARHARMSRDPKACTRFGDVALYDDVLVDYIKQDTVGYLYRAASRGASMLLEGTQGSGLSLIHGPWPYVTSADTNVAQLCADCGLAPSWLTNVMLVARTFPIRVAGNSGPLRGEMSWEDLSNRIGEPVTERTTVTKKTRRVGSWDDNIVVKAVQLNRPTVLAFTFLDYLDPANKGVDRFDKLTPATQAWIDDKSVLMRAPARYLGVGGDEWHVIDRMAEEPIKQAVLHA